jgi:hypothetical protein
MKTIEKAKVYNAAPGVVFKYLDDLGVTGMHMTKSSMPMMGGKLNVVFLSANRSGLNSEYRWTGKVVGLTLDFTVKVTKWIMNEEKIWETIGEPKLIIYSMFRMNLRINPEQNGTEARLSISYQKPKGLVNMILSFLFADWYCRWCLNNMLEDTGRSIEKASNSN